MIECLQFIIGRMLHHCFSMLSTMGPIQYIVLKNFLCSWLIFKYHTCALLLVSRIMLLFFLFDKSENDAAFLINEPLWKLLPCLKLSKNIRLFLIEILLLLIHFPDRMIFKYFINDAHLYFISSFFNLLWIISMILTKFTLFKYGLTLNREITEKQTSSKFRISRYGIRMTAQIVLIAFITNIACSIISTQHKENDGLILILLLSSYCVSDALFCLEFMMATVNVAVVNIIFHEQNDAPESQKFHVKMELYILLAQEYLPGCSSAEKLHLHLQILPRRMRRRVRLQLRRKQRPRLSLTGYMKMAVPLPPFHCFIIIPIQCFVEQGTIAQKYLAHVPFPNKNEFYVDSWSSLPLVFRQFVSEFVNDDVNTAA
jgi:hypothetical protein